MAAFPSETGGWDLPTLLHEAATPLQGAIGLLEGGDEGLDRDGCLRVLRSLGRLRDLFRAAAGESPAAAAFAPWDAVESLVGELRASHPGRRISLAADVASRRPHRLDRLALVQTAANWVLNALRHAPGSEVRVRLESPPAKAALCLEVEDDGEGLGEEDRRRVFERGWRAGSSSRRDPSGKGLGLAIVRRLVTSAGGRIRVGASASGGCRFTLILPATPAEECPEPEATLPSGAKVAVIDDDPTCGAVAVLGLRAEGIAAERLRPERGLLRTLLGGSWEAILLDRKLGSMDGARLARRLRAAGWAGGIVLWTGDGRPPTSHVDGRLPKPSSRREMVDAVATAVAAALDRRAARRVLRDELEAGAREVEAAAGDLRKLGALAHRLAGALGLAGYPAAARRAQAVERACARGAGAGPWRKLIGDLRALAKRPA